jgi:hypothetical protein
MITQKYRRHSDVTTDAGAARAKSTRCVIWTVKSRSRRALGKQTRLSMRGIKAVNVCMLALGGNVCGRPAINSHTVPRKMLKQIARNGHVYWHSGSVQDLEGIIALSYSVLSGITAYLQNGGTLEHAQQIAAHQSPRTTKLYDRTKDEISLDEVERIKF